MPLGRLPQKNLARAVPPAMLPAWLLPCASSSSAARTPTSSSTPHACPHRARPWPADRSCATAAAKGANQAVAAARAGARVTFVGARGDDDIRHGRRRCPAKGRHRHRALHRAARRRKRRGAHHRRRRGAREPDHHRPLRQRPASPRGCRARLVRHREGGRGRRATGDSPRRGCAGREPRAQASRSVHSQSRAGAQTPRLAAAPSVRPRAQRTRGRAAHRANAIPSAPRRSSSPPAAARSSSRSAQKARSSSRATRFQTIPAPRVKPVDNRRRRRLLHRLARHRYRRRPAVDQGRRSPPPSPRPSPSHEPERRPPCQSGAKSSLARATAEALAVLRPKRERGSRECPAHR